MSDDYNILDVVKDEFRGNAKYTHKDLINDRENICRNCENRIVIMPKTFGNCKLCGCFLKFKIRYLKSKCPINRW